MKKMDKKDVSYGLPLHLVKRVLYLLPIMWLIALVTSFGEAYFYPGVISKHTPISALLIYLVFGIVGLFGLYGTEWKNKPLRMFRKLSYFAVYIFGAGYLLFYLLEKIHYPNYVFSTFHIHPAQLATPLALSVYAYAISSKDVLLMILNNSEILFKWFPITTILLWILIQNFIEVGMSAGRDLSFMAKNPTASYDQKMEEKLGKQFYNYALFVKENTPEDSKILLPPFPANPWPQTGNIPYMTYFLYPRTLLNGEEYSSKHDLKKEGIDYVLVTWGEMQPTSGSHTNGWPKFDVKADKIIYMINEKENREEKGDYVYKKVENKEVWGIIKVKK